MILKSKQTYCIKFNPILPNLTLSYLISPSGGSHCVVSSRKQLRLCFYGILVLTMDLSLNPILFYFFVCDLKIFIISYSVCN